MSQWPKVFFLISLRVGCYHDDARGTKGERMKKKADWTWGGKKPGEINCQVADRRRRRRKHLAKERKGLRRWWSRAASSKRVCLDCLSSLERKGRRKIERKEKARGGGGRERPPRLNIESCSEEGGGGKKEGRAGGAKSSRQIGLTRLYYPRGTYKKERKEEG